MNQNESAEWNAKDSKEAGDLNLQGIKFSPYPPPAQRLEVKQDNKGMFVRNIPREITNKELRQIFSEHGKVVSVFLKPNTPGVKYNWAIINVETMKDMLTMMSALNKKPPFNFELSVALTEEEKKLRRTGKGEPNVPSSDGGSEQDPWTIDKNQLSGLSQASHSTMVPLAVLNGGTVGSQGLVNEEAGHGYQGMPNEEKVKATVLKPLRNESYEVGRGTVVMEGSRQQACVFCGSRGQMRCSVCKAWYCSMVCQVDDWYHHKDTCRSPPVLDDPRTVHRSLCRAGGEESRATRGTSDAVLSSLSSCADRRDKDLHAAMRKEADLCSSPKTLDKEMLSRGSIANSPGDEDTVLPTRNEIFESLSSSGAIPERSIVGQNGYGVGRGAISKRSSVAPSSSLIGRCDGTYPKGSFVTCGTAEGGFPVGYGLGIVPKGSLGTENGPPRGRGAILQKDVEGNFSMEKGLARGRASILHRNVEGDPAIENSPVRGRAAILPEDVEGGLTIENGPAKEKGAILRRDVEQRCNMVLAPSKKSPAEILSPNPCKTESAFAEVQLSIPSTAKERATPDTVGGTPTDCLRSIKAGSLTDSDASRASSEVSLTKNVAEGRLNFASLLEKGKVYNGFITLVDSYKHFTAAAVVDGTEYIFSEVHEACSSSPVMCDFKPEVGSLVAAFSLIEETWYRAQVLEADGPKYKVCFIDFGNKEVVEKVKPIPKGPFAELPELAFSARFYSGVKEEYESQLKTMVQVDNSIKFKVTAKKIFSVKVILCEEDDENDTAVAEYIFEPLLADSSTASLPASGPTSESKAIPPEIRATSLETKATSLGTNAITTKTKATSPETTITSEINAISSEIKTSFSETKVISPETKITSETEVIFSEARTTSLEPKTTSPETRTAFLYSLKDLNEDSSPQSCLLEDKEEQVLAGKGVMNEPVGADKDALKNCSSSQTMSRDVNSELSTLGGGRACSLYVVPLNTLELLMKMEEMAVEMNKYCGSSTPDGPYQPRQGEVCLAKYDQDGNWYRAACAALGSNSALVVFVDYGNVEKVMYGDIRHIPKQFLEFPCLALHYPRQDSDARGSLEHAKTNALSSFVFLSPLTLPQEGIVKMD